MSFIDSQIRPHIDKFSGSRWLGLSIVVGFFLGFVDTLLIAALLGTVGLKVPAWFGVPTTWSGYLFTGFMLGRLAPAKVLWEIPVGVTICALFLTLGLSGFSGQGFFVSILNYILIPVGAFGAGYLGVYWSRKKPVDKSKLPSAS